MTAPTPNAALAYQVLDAVQAHRKSFDMRDWWNADSDERVTLADLLDEKCGTTACFAGWAMALSGYALGGGVYRDGRHVSYTYGHFAQELLGLDGEQADELFFGDGSDIEDVVAGIFGPRPDDGESAPDRWSAMVPDPHPMSNCGPLLLPLPPGVACPTCGTVPTC